MPSNFSENLERTIEHSHELAIHIQQMQEMGQMDPVQIIVDVGTLLIDLVKLSVGVVSGSARVAKKLRNKL